MRLSPAVLEFAFQKAFDHCDEYADFAQHQASTRLFDLLSLHFPVGHKSIAKDLGQLTVELRPTQKGAYVLFLQALAMLIAGHAPVA